MNFYAKLLIFVHLYNFYSFFIRNDIIAGKRKLSDFTDIEQSVLLAELESRQSRYGNAPQMRYYFMRLYKVIEYFRFVTLINSTSHDIERYDISELKFTVNDSNKLRNIIGR